MLFAGDPTSLAHDNIVLSLLTLNGQLNGDSGVALIYALAL